MAEEKYNSIFCQSSKDIEFGKNDQTEKIYSQMTQGGLVSVETKKKKNSK